MKEIGKEKKKKTWAKSETHFRHENTFFLFPAVSMYYMSL